MMKITVKTLLNTLLLALLAQTGVAQPAGGGGREMNQQAQVEKLITQLSVTAEQEPAFREAMGKVNELRMSSMQGMRGGSAQRDMRRNGPAAPEQGADEHAGHGTAAAPTDEHAGHGGAQQADGAVMRQGQGQGQGRNMGMMMERRAQMQKQITDILTPVLNEKQLAKYAALEEERMAKMMERRSGQQ